MVTDYQDCYAKRLDEERKVNVYFLPIQMKDGSDYYAYVAASALLHDQFMAALEYNQIPDFAVVVARGEGKPDDEIKNKMKEFYGFDHATYESQVEEALKRPREALH